MIDLTKYQSPPWNSSLLQGLPIEMYTKEFMSYLRWVYGRPLRVKFRGPRPVRNDGRTKSLRQSTCLRIDAKTFSVYRNF